MPEIWDAPVYRHRAEAWRKRAELYTNAEQAATCLSIAADYDHLAHLATNREALSQAARKLARQGLVQHPDEHASHQSGLMPAKS
jgi:hypothetical protein